MKSAIALIKSLIFLRKRRGIWVRIGKLTRLVEVEINKNKINDYLKSDVDPLMLHPDRPNVLIGVVRLHSEKIPEVQLRLFKLQAMILWAQYKVQQRKEGDSLKLLITQLMVEH
jgi:hypothetical protein